MDIITILAVALSLSFDTFAVSLSYGVVRFRILFRQAFLVAVILALFQGGFTIAGYFLGSVISDLFKSLNHWMAFFLLSFLGVRMIHDGMRKGHRREDKDYSRLLVIITIAFGSSIDAFAAGISFGLLDIRIWLSGILIAAVTFLASMTAIRIGKSAGERLGLQIEIVGGIILIITGIKILLEYMQVI